mgnify:CR=1 FL=1
MARTAASRPATAAARAAGSAAVRAAVRRNEPQTRASRAIRISRRKDGVSHVEGGPLARPGARARHAAVRLFEAMDARRAGRLPARLRGPRCHGLLCDEGQLLARRAAASSPRPAAASTSSRAANWRACWPPAPIRPEIIFSGVGKTRAEMRQALGAGIGCFNVESEAETRRAQRGRARGTAVARRSACASIPTSIRRRTPTSRPA